MAEHEPESAGTADIAPSVAADESPRRRPAAPSVPRVAWLIGPALVAGVAYLDPGNVASDMTRGRRAAPARMGRRARQRHGVAHPVPLGEARHRHRPEPARGAGRHHPQPLGPSRLLAAAELVAMATDLAEVHRRRRRAQPAVQRAAPVGRAHHRRRLDRAARAAVPARAPHLHSSSWGCSSSSRSASPSASSWRRPTRPASSADSCRASPTPNSVLLAASILGATIMPHAIYAHSALSRDRFARAAPRSSPAGAARPQDEPGTASASAAVGASARPAARHGDRRADRAASCAPPGGTSRSRWRSPAP